MKKTLLLLTLSASLLGLSHAADSNSTTDEQSVTLTFSNTAKEPADNTGGGSWHGVAFTLSSDPSRLAVTCEGLTDIPSFSTFDLESISIKVRADTIDKTYSWADTAACIIDDATNKVLARSTGTTGTVSGGAIATFNFNSLTLNVNTGYKLFFIDPGHINDASFDEGALMTTADYWVGRQMAAFAAGESTKMAECGLTSGLNSITAEGYAPVVSIQGHILIPEPTTATLSLLALAGLAARRRRK